jgi:hypothetical protein
MPSYKVLNPLAWHGRHERGEVLEMPESEAQAFGSDYLEPLPAPAAESEPKATQTEEEAKPKKIMK